jgi:polyphosphate kinase 2 (PPK2 family)
VQAIDDELMRRIRNDLIDSYDEELEMELEDRTVAELTGAEVPVRTEQDKENRRQYFRELFRLQGELVKLQDWVVNTGHKVVILFEAAMPPAKAA